VSQTTTKENYTGAGASGAGGTLGTSGASSSGTGSGNGKYSKESTTVDNSLGTRTQTVHTAPGQVQTLSIAVAVDSKVKNVSLAAITNLIKSGSGYSQARGDSLSVQSLPFDNTGQAQAAAAATAAAKAAAAQASSAHLTGMIKQGALAFLVLAVIIGAALASRKRKKKSAGDPDDDVLELDESIEDRATTAHLAPVTDLRSAAERRRTLVATADDRPEDVARVLSGWLNTKES
jgi:flagellar M-ring protein FliF